MVSRFTCLSFIILGSYCTFTTLYPMETTIGNSPKPSCTAKTQLHTAKIVPTDAPTADIFCFCDDQDTLLHEKMRKLLADNAQSEIDPYKKLLLTHYLDISCAAAQPRDKTAHRRDFMRLTDVIKHLPDSIIDEDVYSHILNKMFSYVQSTLENCFSESWWKENPFFQAIMATSRFDKSGKINNKLTNLVLYPEKNPVFVAYDLNRRSYFSRPLSAAPQYAHNHGLACTGHSNNALYEEICTELQSIEKKLQYNNSRTPISLKHNLLQRQHFLSTYLDYSCSKMHNAGNSVVRLAAILDTQFKIARKWQNTVATEPLYTSVIQEIVKQFKTVFVQGSYDLSDKNIASFENLFTAILFDTSNVILEVLQSRQDAVSQYAYGMCLLHGYGTQKDTEKACTLLLNALAQEACPQEIKKQCIRTLVEHAKQLPTIFAEFVIALAKDPANAADLESVLELFEPCNGIVINDYVQELSNDRYYKHVITNRHLMGNRHTSLCIAVATCRLSTANSVEKQALLTDIDYLFDAIKDLPDFSTIKEQLLAKAINACAEVECQQECIELYKIGADHDNIECTTKLAKYNILNPLNQTDIHQGITMLETAASSGSAEAGKFLNQLLSGSIEFKSKDAYKRASIFNNLREQKELEHKLQTVNALLEKKEKTPKETKKIISLSFEIATHHACAEPMRNHCLDLLEHLALQGHMRAFAHHIIALAQLHLTEKLDKQLATIDLSNTQTSSKYLELLAQDNYFEQIKQTCPAQSGFYMALCAAVIAHKLRTTKTPQNIRAIAAEVSWYYDIAKGRQSLEKIVNDLTWCAGEHYFQHDDPKNAMKFYSLGASNGSPKCMFNLGSYNVLNSKNLSDAQNGTNLLSKAAGLGYVNAQQFLINLYRGALPLSPAINEALKNTALVYKYADMVTTSEPNDIDTKYLLATMLYAEGGKNGIPVDEDRAYRLLEQLSNEKDFEIDLRCFIFMSNTAYKKNDFEKAKFWLKKADSSCCARMLGAFLDLTSCYPQQNRETSFSEIEKYFVAISKDINQLNDQYFNSTDQNIWIDLLKKLFAGDDEYLKVVTSYLLCRIDDTHLVGTTMISQAIDYLKKMAQDNNHLALFCLAQLTFLGIQCQQSFEKTERYLETIIKENRINKGLIDGAYHNMLWLAQHCEEPCGTRAAYFAVPFLIKQGRSQFELAHRILQIAELKKEALRPFDPEINNLLFISGAYDALLNAKEEHPPFNKTLGICLFTRACNSKTQDPIKAGEGLKLLENYLQYDSSADFAQLLAQSYISAATICLKSHAVPIDCIVSYAKRALSLDPKCYIEAKKIIARGYKQRAEVDTSGESLALFEQASEELAELGDEEHIIQTAEHQFNIACKGTQSAECTATAKSIDKCIQRLMTAIAYHSNYYGLILLSLSPHKPAIPVLQQTVNALICNLPHNNPLKNDSLYKVGLMAIITEHYSEASDIFETLSENHKLPNLLLVSAYMQFVKLNNAKKALCYVMTAFKRAQDQKIAFDKDLSSFLLLTKLAEALKHATAEQACYTLLLNTFKLYNFDSSKQS